MQRKELLLLLLFDTNSDVAKKKLGHFFFSWRHTKTFTKKTLKKKKEEGRKRCWDCALPSPARARKDTTTTSARLDARAPAEGACIIVVFVAARFFGEHVSNSFTLMRRIDDDDGRQRQNLTDRLLLSSSSSSSSRARATQQVDESDP